MAKHKLDLEQALRQLPEVPMRPEAKEQLLARMRAVHQASHQPDASPPARRRMIFPTGRVGRLAAAGLVLAVTLGGLWWLLSGSAAIASISFGEVMRKVRMASTIRYEMAVYEGGQFADRCQVSFAKSGQLVRQTSLTEGNTVIYDFIQNKELVLTNENKATGTLTELHPGGGWDEPIRSLANLADSAGKACGTEIVHGRTTEIFEAQGKNQTTRMWVDPQRNLPVKVQITTRAAPPAAAMVVTIDHIEWDCPLDASLFALRLPPGYLWSFERISAATEQDLLAMLEAWAHMNDGRFPQKLDRQGLETFGEQQLKRTGRAHSFYVGQSLNQSYIVDGAMQEMFDKARLGLRFVRKMGDSQWHWVGGGVRLGEANVPVAWWCQEDHSGYRIVYGDLTIRDSQELDLPAAPATTVPAQ
jgi:hypothetical protein